ncbi:hypothetical protein SBOR_3555 [Sclerotinia borealis F-4128]|uniref:Uncharacterized protein n=1 Tax=Sclerotinia borealis (strain F-4128) TaxID=1432307 RepID=W9CJ89_SCLBF|nr:hypothetical protein SBOR_3555 [Sclerotinia borealis F-4128]
MATYNDSLTTALDETESYSRVVRRKSNSNETNSNEPTRRLVTDIYLCCHIEERPLDPNQDYADRNTFMLKSALCRREECEHCTTVRKELGEARSRYGRLYWQVLVKALWDERISYACDGELLDGMNPPANPFWWFGAFIDDQVALRKHHRN